MHERWLERCSTGSSSPSRIGALIRKQRRNDYEPSSEPFHNLMLHTLIFNIFEISSSNRKHDFYINIGV